MRSRILASLALLTAIGLGSACEPVTTPPDSDDNSDSGTNADSDSDSDSEVAARAWTFEAVPGMVCGRGHETGIGTSDGGRDDVLAILLAGGGACWDAWTCFGLASAANLEVHWGDAQLQAETSNLRGRDLVDGASGLADAPWAYIPYCTGDLHIGRSQQVYNALEPQRVVHHAGDRNLQLAIAALQQAHPDITDLYVYGISAGGYGAQLQADRFAAAWPDASIHLFADGAPMIQPWEYRWSSWQTAWDARLPAGCTDCATSLPAVLDRQLATESQVDLSLATYSEDAVITLFFARPLGGLAQAQAPLLTDVFAPSDRADVFYVEGTNHVLLDHRGAAVDGSAWGDWLGRWTHGEANHDAAP